MKEGNRDDWLLADDDVLLAACDFQTFKASGPGGQHRNKTSSGVRLVHAASGVTAEATERRSQHENRRMALRRLRQAIALEVRCPPPSPGAGPPEIVRSCLHAAGKGGKAGRRLEVGRKDRRFWPVAAVALDLLDHHAGRLAASADDLGISTSNLAALFRSDRHLRAAATAVRKRHGLGGIR